MQTYDIKTISITDPLYPSGFKHLKDAPASIYVQGNLDLLTVKSPRLGIVGSRKATPYGREVTYDLTHKMAERGVIIISGLAIGIDSYAHRAAIDSNGPTIAILPSDLHTIYPASHAGLARQILDSGGLLISEYKNHPNVLPFEFIKRNRLVAALCDLLLVTEAAKKSGTLSTVRFAEELNKTVAAVPGNINSPMSKGVNKLFFDGVQPVLEFEDLLMLLGVDEKIMKPKPYKPENELEASILTSLEIEEYSTNELAERTSIPIHSLNAHLSILEIRGIIHETSARTWRIKT